MISRLATVMGKCKTVDRSQWLNMSSRLGRDVNSEDNDFDIDGIGGGAWTKEICKVSPKSQSILNAVAMCKRPSDKRSS